MAAPNLQLAVRQAFPDEHEWKDKAYDTFVTMEENVDFDDYLNYLLVQRFSYDKKCELLTSYIQDAMGCSLEWNKTTI